MYNLSPYNTISFGDIQLFYVTILPDNTVLLVTYIV